jgi:hypothetical protein
MTVDDLSGCQCIADGSLSISPGSPVFPRAEQLGGPLDRFVLSMNSLFVGSMVHIRTNSGDRFCGVVDLDQDPLIVVPAHGDDHQRLLQVSQLVDTI